VSLVSLSDVSVRRGTSMLLQQVSLEIREGERWVVIGANGAGKTTLMQVMAARLFPTTGEVEVLDETLGATDVASLRQRIGWASAAQIQAFPPAESVLDVVATGAFDVTGRWREAYEPLDLRRAQALMRQWGIESLADRTFGTLSEGERKRTMIARALMPDPELLLLDEPGAGLDLAGREDLVTRLAALARDPAAPALVVITHHVEEVPPGFTHGLVLRSGRTLAQGPLAEVMTQAVLSEASALPLQVEHSDGRYWARGRADT
jgi:iron complex transport system ATP-binding protein